MQIIEKWIHYQLQDYLKENDLLYNYQPSFKKIYYKSLIFLHKYLRTRLKRLLSNALTQPQFD